MLTSLAMMLTMQEQGFSYSREKENYRENSKKYPKESRPQKGQFHYWFRADVTFLNEKQEERMKKDECVFVCFAINDKNAIKKFNKFKKPC